MAKSKKNKVTGDTQGIKGFFRVQLTEDGKVVGDSGWTKNQVVDIGVRDYIVQWLCSGAAGTAVTHMALGTGTAPGAAATTQDGELFHKSTNATTNSRAAVSTSIVASRTAQFTAAFNSVNSFVTASANISNVGLWNTYLTSLASAGALFAGNTYASSSCATNQNVKSLRHLSVMVGSKLRKFGGSLKELIISLKTIPSQAYAIA